MKPMLITPRRAGQLLAATMLTAAGSVGLHGAVAAPGDPAAGAATTAGKSQSPWEAQALAHISRVDNAQVNRRARNVILFLGDGMGVPTVTATRIYRGQQRGGTGEEHSLPWETFPWSALVKTYNTDQQTPDSAGTMSAIVTGRKTRAGVISVDSSVPRGDCGASQSGALVTILEQAEQAGLATGVVSTTRITHATPAATYAHAADRAWEAATGDDRCADIARQLVEFSAGDGPEVVMGGGRQMFLPKETTDPEYPDRSGARTDGRDLIQAWRDRYPDGAWAWNGTQFASLQQALPARLLGLFSPSHMAFEVDRGADPGTEPSLAAMTQLALRMLQRNAKGYFLMVEGGRIDHGHHAGNSYRALGDGVALAEAVAMAAQLTDATDTLIIVTADHAHTLTLAGYPARGSPILGLALDQTGNPMLDARGQPYTILGYANGPGYQQKPQDLRKVDPTAPDYRQTAAVPMQMETHSGTDVAAWARGPGAFYLRGVVEQSHLYYIMAKALGLY